MNCTSPRHLPILRLCAAIALSLTMAGSAFAQVSVTGAPGAKLSDLVGSPTLVTVRLKKGGEDRNLQVVDVGPTYVSFRMENGARTAYTFDAIQEIKVQGGKVEEREFKLDRSRTLTSDEQKVVELALEKARSLFGSNTDQAVKMDAATILALQKDGPALEYLRQLATSNDLHTALEASRRLYLAGDLQVSDDIISMGLASGNRASKAVAAQLAGVLNAQGHETALMRMLRDRIGEIAAPAMRALARQGNEEVIPVAIQGLEDLNVDRGEAAVFALTQFKDNPEIAETLKERVEDAEGFGRFRIGRVLYALNDPVGRKLMEDDFLDVPTLAVETAMILARSGNRDGIIFLNNRLEERYNPTPEVLKLRAKMAGALIEGGEGNAIGIMQEMLRSDDPVVQQAACDVVAQSGSRRLLPVAQPSLESAEAQVLLAGCYAAMASANPDFHQRLRNVREN